MNAAEEVDLVNVSIALTRRNRSIWRIVLSPDIDTPSRAHPGTKFTSDTFLTTILVPVEHMAAVKTRRLRPLLLRVLLGDSRLEDLADRDFEAT